MNEVKVNGYTIRREAGGRYYIDIKTGPRMKMWVRFNTIEAAAEWAGRN